MSKQEDRGMPHGAWPGSATSTGVLAVAIAMIAIGCAQATPQPTSPPAGSGAPAASSGGTPAGGAAPAATEVKDDWGVITIPANGQVKVGFAAALSGAYAKLGKDIENAVKMAAEEKGAIQGLKIQVLSEDDQCEGAPSVNVARKFTADDQVVGAVAHMCSGGTVAAMDIYHEKKMVMISPSSTSIDVTKKGLPVVFRTAWNDLIQGRAAADFAKDKLKAKKVAIIHDKSNYGQGLAEEFQRNIRTGGAEVVAFEGITRGDKDFSPVLTKIKPAAPEVLYFGGMAAEATLLVQQLKSSGITTAFLTDDGAYDAKDFIEAAGGAAEGAFVTYAELPKAAQYTTWKDNYQKKFSSEIGTFSSQGYDATKILLDAVDKVAKKQADGSLKIGRKALADAIRSTKWEGVTGTINFDANGDRSGSIVVVNTVKGKEFLEVK